VQKWFGNLTQELGVKPKILEGDIRDMTWVWEEAVTYIPRPSVLAVFYTLRAITRSYLRGRALRMGNWQGWEKHSFTETMLMLCLIGYVTSEEGAVFDALREAGLGSMESFLERFILETAGCKARKKRFDILEEVRRMLDEQKRQEGEP